LEKAEHMKILFVVFVSLILFVPIRAGECLRMTLKKSLENADAVFAGKVLKITEVEPDESDRRQETWIFGTLYKVRVRVEQYWKGASTKETDFLIYFGGTETNWTFEFKEGERFLVFAKKGRDTDDLYVDPCAGTDKIENAKKDLEELGKGKRIK